jgi:hypothetical protein
MIGLFWLRTEGTVHKDHGIVAVRQLLRSCYVHISCQLPVSVLDINEVLVWPLII